MAKRRPSGDGMVRKREDGRWEGRIVVGHMCLAMESGGKRSVSFSRGVTARKYGIAKNTFTRHCSELEEAGFIQRIEDGDFLQFAPATYKFSLDWKSKPAPQIGAG